MVRPMASKVSPLLIVVVAFFKLVDMGSNTSSGVMMTVSSFITPYCPKIGIWQEVLVIRQLDASRIDEFEVFSGLRSRPYFEMGVCRLLLVSLARWMNRQQLEVIE